MVAQSHVTTVQINSCLRQTHRNPLLLLCSHQPQIVLFLVCVILFIYSALLSRCNYSGICIGEALIQRRVFHQLVGDKWNLKLCGIAPSSDESRRKRYLSSSSPLTPKKVGTD